ncbi:MAG: tRNA 2-thiouridine(34) synthase MnmA [Patescibacteria group bacterium]|nr:tRNA 2-thiouridine(34) synthase MnmA [Patescibacteria group bacterium]
MKIAVAMSGGVDSSVAAALMVKKYGKENVFGVTAKLFCYSGKEKEKACCSLSAIDDARSICAKLGIPHYVLSEEKEFEEAVIKDFVSAYRHGQTPIPCIPCNSVIKFGTMLEHARKLGAEKLVTGHYTQVTRKGNSYRLLRGVCEEKDQSYFLYRLSQKQLARVEFPVGEMEKREVRKIAKDMGLKVAEKKESQGVCFVTEERVTDYLADKIETKSGDIINTKGEKVGTHEGYIFYTIGQRKRIGGGHAEPMFVLRIDPISNQVVIGPKDELYGNELVFINSSWVSDKEPKMPLKCTAKIRYNTEDAPCTVNICKEKHMVKELSKSLPHHYHVSFKNPERAITPGQSIVLYNKEIVLGGGVII